VTEIPKGNHDSPGPCWIPTFRRVNPEGKLGVLTDPQTIPCKPVIKCQCGDLCGIALHHVHADGTVTASFFHSQEPSFMNKGKTYTHRPGCGWHVWLKLLDYDCGDFPPVED
jgi:hypothetical protein